LISPGGVAVAVAAWVVWFSRSFCFFLALRLAFVDSLKFTASFDSGGMREHDLAACR